MNKKFSTLLCASLMLSAFSVRAQEAYNIENNPNGNDAAPTEFLKSATPSEVFQIRYDNGTTSDLSDDLVLIVDKVGGKYVYRAVKPSEIPNLKASLWCLQLTQENAGKEPIYDFINKETGLPLAFDGKETSEVGQSFAGWAFSSTWAKGIGLSDRADGKKGLSMYTYVNTDKVLRIKKAANFATTGEIDTEEINANVAEEERRTNSQADAIFFKLYNAGSYVLSADELNAFLKENNYKLKFEPDDSYGENPFSNTQLYALPAVGNSTTHNFLYIASKASKKATDAETKEKGTFLKVDTVSNGVGIEFLKLGWTDLTAKDKNGNLVNTNVASISRIPEQHKFLFTYKPTSDEILIQVASALHRDDTDPTDAKGNYWNSETNTQVAKFRNDYPESTDALKEYKYHELDCASPLKEWVVPATVDANEADMLFIKLNNFTKGESVVTVGFQSINTKISFNMRSCVAPNLTSVEEDIYVIYNEKGQVLAAPIHLNDDAGDNTAHWVTLDAQDPNHMPAYQWIVTKVRNTDNTTKAEAIKTSPVVIRNREYPDLYTANVQFVEENGNIVASNVKIVNNDIVNFEINFNGKAEEIFVPVPLENKMDAKLGYRFLSEDSLKVNKYVFNYLNPFTPDYWIANGSDKDSVNYVKKTADRYKLESGRTSKYGYGWDKNNESTEAKVMKRLNFVRLERTNYVIKTADGKKSLVESYNEKYGMGVTNYDANYHAGLVPFMVDTFFFKENNHWEGKHFYAIVETSPLWDNGHYYYKDGMEVVNHPVVGTAPATAKYVRPIIRSLNTTTSKVGTADDGMSAVLKVQNLEETRTSAFTVEPDQTPLYRRFHNAMLGENAGENLDATDTLYFREKIRGEYLMDEWNNKLQNEGVDYAGIWSENEAAALNPASKGKYAFIVDTAWVRRGAGFVKPQYLISVDRHDQGAIETIPCTEADGTHFYIDEDGKAHSTDKWHCQHATKGRPGFRYGKYLISFGDSAIANGLDKPYMDIKGGYTRVGFVEAIHYGDSLYILDEEFAKVAKEDPAKLSVEKIIAAYKKAGKNLIVNLKGDNHKNATWSFRYVDPMNAMQAYNDGVEGENNEFMFESNIYNEKAATAQYASVAGVSVDGKATRGYDHVVDGSIAPKYAAWLKMQNGCLVLTRGDASFDDAKTGSDGALIFNAYQAADKDLVTSNDEVAVEGVSVVAGNGSVTVQGAAGKSVVITNILGKVVAETVLTSDNATIAVPAGIVAVAVDGEEAVKAIVK